MEGLAIVTGGAGFIGSHLVGRLVESGQPVRVVERPEAPVGHLPDGVDVVFADIRDRGALAQALRRGAMGLSSGGESQLMGARSRRV